MIPRRLSHFVTATAIAFAIALVAVTPLNAQSISTSYRAAADSLINAALKDSAAWNRLAKLTDTFGNRLSGSRSLETAIDWAIGEMKRDGLDDVHGEPAMVTHWVRGEESLALVSPRNAPLRILGLGGSVATPKKGITAPVIVVGSFDELTSRAAEAKGKIVLFDVPFTTYRETVAYRVGGASAAAKAGALAALVRSVTPMSFRTPHTGVMHYDSTIAKIPTAAVTVEDALMIRRMLARGEKVVVTLKMNARTLAPSPSRNVVAEVRGWEKPDEVVVISGHFDSWDVGQGAMDDGGGAVAAWEAVRLIKQLGLKPRRTVRVVLWTNEENGGAGGKAYLAAHRADVDKHLLAIESDNGVFKPRGVAFTGTDSATAIIRQVAHLLDGISAGSVVADGGGSDIEPLMTSGVPGMSPDVDESRYFWYHHTEADTMDKLDPHEVALCVATMAVMAYVVADMPAPLPHGSRAARPL